MMKPKNLVGPKPPRSLSPGAKEEWRELAPIAWNLGSLNAQRFRGFEVLCEALAQERAARAAIAAEGITIGEAKKAHPALKIQAEARRVALGLLIDFQLSARPGHLYSPLIGAEEALDELNDSASAHCFARPKRKRRRKKLAVAQEARPVDAADESAVEQEHL